MGNNMKRTMKKSFQRGLSVLLIVFMVAGSNLLPFSNQLYIESEAAGTMITSMSYFSEGDGPILTGVGVGSASFGFVMPIFNDGSVTWEDVANDLKVNVKVNGSWIDIDTIDRFIYNNNWGNWSDGGFHGYWFSVSETTELQLVSKTNANVTLEYTLQFTNLSKLNITSMEPTQGPEITAGVTGGSGFTYPKFNGDASITHEQIAEDLEAFVWSDESNSWVTLNNNAASGWIYDQNFGNFYDGGGGFWFTVEKTTRVRLASKSSPNVYLDYTIIYNEPVRTTNTVSAPTTTFTAGETGAIGIPLPLIDGGFPINKEIERFVYELKVGNDWVELSDFSRSNFSYQANGYNNLSDKNQWGYWVDGIYGLWFQPIQEDMELRIGYPQNGVKGGEIGNNYVVYNFIGNPNAARPDISDLGNIELGTSDNSEIADWNLIWNDEFSGNELDMNKWNYNTGYFIDDNPDHWGWGNAELEYYTDSTKNVFVEDGKLNLKALYEPTTFPEIDPDRVAEYSSGKVTTKDNFKFKYGRIDYAAKLPAGDGLWPACWLLPDDDTYGSWAASGEIDVMEARGRLPGSTSGAVHYGGVWPANTHTGSDYSFKDGQRMDTDFHVYSVVWEEDNIKWYVDGECFFKITNEQWYSMNSNGNKNAPFDQEFYVIMNLAVGGWFDGGIRPGSDFVPSTMQIDYVRVYQAEGSTNGSYTDNSGSSENPSTSTDVAVGKTVIASGSENEAFVPSNLTDGNDGTRWAANFADDAWFVIDLGDNYNINKMVLNWEASYAKKYEIQVSNDGNSYRNVATKNDGAGGVETITFASTNARYVKFQGIERALPYGYSLWDVKVMGAK